MNSAKKRMLYLKSMDYKVTAMVAFLVQEIEDKNEY